MRKRTPTEILARHELDELDKKILHMRLTYPSMSATEMSGVLGCDRTTIRIRMKKKPWQDAWNEFHTPAKTLIEKSAERITRKYLKLCDNADLKIAERAMRAILTSCGILKNKVDIDSEGFKPFVIVNKFTNEVITVRGNSGNKIEGGATVEELGE